ncbi:MAG: hypothetical protein OXD54_02025 [Candidatus Poribacteria bacterium]|nr:hypothetical protein [Candidatus Poribacteria bacterium]
MEHKIPKAFFAYPSSRDSLNEAIQNAVPLLNKSGLVNIKTWEECNPSGNFIIKSIRQAIDEAELFFADLTGLNHNVMFELGYAIAHNKRIWLIFDDTYTEAKKLFNQLMVLTTVGYTRCCNSDDIVKRFHKEKPYVDIKNTIFHSQIECNLEESKSAYIFHLKREHEDQAAVRVSNLLQKRFTDPVPNDDPRESTGQSLEWYGSNVFDCNGVICHFMSSKREGGYIQTARQALVCGMASGWEKPLLMLAEDDFLPPIDFRDDLRSYKTSLEALRYLEEWLPPVEQTIKVAQEATGFQHTVKLARDLRSLRFGDHVAEYEEEKLVEEYFIPTAAYYDAVRGNQTLFVGRKGSGKTANLIKLKDELSRHQRNVVCVIKPQRFQMLGIVDLLKKYQRRNVKAYTIESLWKFLLLTEIANTVYNNLPSLQNTEITERFFNFIENNRDIICEDFSTRLEICIQKLEESIDTSEEENSYSSVSEALHSSILRELRIELGNFLSNERRIAILIDNLDQAWERQNDIDALSEILWNLLEVAKKLPKEVQQQSDKQYRLELSLAVFLRSDIFYRIRQVADEPDKMTYSLLNWDDTDLLRIIEERFYSLFENEEPHTLWERYFCTTVKGTPTREYITGTILKRPRDIIYFVNEAVRSAINNRHPKIEEDDIFQAEKLYFTQALDSIKVENTSPDINLENVIYEFAGMSDILYKNQVVVALKSAGISDERTNLTIDLLHDLTFLGIEIGEDKFVFSDDPESSHKNKIMARRFTEIKNQEKRFQIHPAFRAFLEINET